jgi:hypothetical protein
MKTTIILGAFLGVSIPAYAGSDEMVDVPINIFAGLYDRATTRCQTTNDCEDIEMLFKVMKRNNWCVSPNNGHVIARCPR